MSSKGCLHSRRNEFWGKRKIRERYTDDHRAGIREKLYSQWELGSEKSTESTPYPRLNRAAELASFWDPQRMKTINEATCDSEDASEIEHWTTL